MSPRNPEQNKQIRDERREQILRVALNVFARRGLAATKISEIAAAAGLSHGLVYHYFSSKGEIFTDLVERALDDAIGTVQEAARQPGDTSEQLRWLTEAILSPTGEYTDYFLLILQAFSSDSVPPEAKELVVQKGPVISRHLASLLGKGQANGEIAAGDLFSLGNAYFSFLQGINLMRLQGDPTPSATYAELVLRLFRP